MHRAGDAGRGVTRRQALAGAAAAAGAAALAGPRGAVAGHGHQRHDYGDGRAPHRVAPTLTLTGGRLLDPATGRVTDDATVVFADGRVRRAGRRRACCA